MNNINCDIIKDLLPSYIDKICSDATKQCVEEHLETCADCRQAAMLCKSNVLSADKINQRSLDGLKKIRHKIKARSFISYAVFILMIYIGVWIFIFHKNIPSPSAVTGLCALCMLASLFSYTSYKGKRKPGKAEYILSAVSLGANAYLAILILSLFHKMQIAESLADPEIIRQGQAIYSQLVVCFCLHIVFFFYILVCTVKQDKNCSLPACINIMGIFLLVKYFLCLALMDSLETLIKGFVYEVSEAVIIGILGITASILISKYQNRKKPLI